MHMKRISATDAKNHWGTFVRAITEGSGAVVVENRNKPLFVAIAPEEFDDYESFLKERKLRRARAALSEIQHLQADRNDDLSDAEVEELGVRAAREIREELDRDLSGQPISTR